LTAPGSEARPQPQGPGAGGGFISAQPPQPDANAEAVLWVRDIAEKARRLGMKYPAALSEVREIHNALARLQSKLAQSQPAPEPVAPPV
jgi:hypothetical protein